MLWTLTAGPTTKNDVPQRASDGRFVLHRHRDELGPHLDLRIEFDGFLMGWRIASEDLNGRNWANIKPPHAIHWLDLDAEARRVDHGTYSWEEQTRSKRVLVLHGQRGATRVVAEQDTRVTPQVMGELAEVLREHDQDNASIISLVADGSVARKRAIERLCGLGLELDGATFDDSAWRRLLRAQTLSEIGGHLCAYEARFDAKYPPAPVSQPEPLDEEEANPRRERAIAILKD